MNDEYDEHGRQEQSDGKVITGSYHVVLPDSRKQIVTYTADPYTGFKAEVTYEGEAQYPEYVPATPDYTAQGHKPEYKAQYQPEYKPQYKPEYKPAYKPEY